MESTRESCAGLSAPLGAESVGRAIVPPDLEDDSAVVRLRETAVAVGRGLVRFPVSTLALAVVVFHSAVVDKPVAWMGTYGLALAVVTVAIAVRTYRSSLPSEPDSSGRLDATHARLYRSFDRARHGAVAAALLQSAALIVAQSGGPSQLQLAVVLLVGGAWAERQTLWIRDFSVHGPIAVRHARTTGFFQGTVAADIALGCILAAGPLLRWDDRWHATVFGLQFAGLGVLLVWGTGLSELAAGHVERYVVTRSRRWAAVESRERARTPVVVELLRRLRLHPGQQVAEVGAGLGFLTVELARMVGPEGRVVATDVRAGFVASIRVRAEQAGLGQIEAVVVQPEAPLGNIEKVDAIVVLNAFLFDGANPERTKRFLADAAARLHVGGSLFIALDRRRRAGFAGIGDARLTADDPTPFELAEFAGGDLLLVDLVELPLDTRAKRRLEAPGYVAVFERARERAPRSSEEWVLSLRGREVERLFEEAAARPVERSVRRCGPFAVGGSLADGTIVGIDTHADAFVVTVVHCGREVAIRVASNAPEAGPFDRCGLSINHGPCDIEGPQLGSLCTAAAHVIAGAAGSDEGGDTLSAWLASAD